MSQESRWLVAEKWSANLVSLAERHRRLLIMLFSVVVLALSVTSARARPFWHDEIYTVVMSGLPSEGSIWAAERDGLDSAPPLNVLITREVHRLLGVGRIATRLPSILGFWVMTLVVFHLVSR